MSENFVEAPAKGGAWDAVKRLSLFLLVAVAGVALSHYAKLGDYLSTNSILELAGKMGPHGVAIIFLAGAITPLLFLPRWPIAFLAGLLYGVLWGTLLASVASTLGAWLHFVLSRSLLAPASERIKRRFGWNRLNVPREKQFIMVFLLRAFPLSSFVATNILAGALKLSQGRYLVASFLGMLPTSVMYAVWGKLLKKPDSHFYWVAIGAVVLIVIGSVLARRYIGPLLRPSPDRATD